MCMPGEVLHDSEGVAAALSESLGLPVIDLHFSDDVIWGYTLFQAGREVDRYASRPNYWEEQSPEEIKKQSGNALVVASVWPEVTADEIVEYLTNKELLTDEAEESRAYPEDHFSVSDAWQLCDFMRKLGLNYPFDEEGEPTSQPITSLLIGTPKGLIQKADFEEKAKAVEEEMRRYREQMESHNG